MDRACRINSSAGDVLIVPLIDIRSSHLHDSANVALPLGVCNVNAIVLGSS